MEKQQLIPFLTFSGSAEEAMNFYSTTLPTARIESLVLYESAEQGGDIGKVLNGILSFKGQRIMFMDMAKGTPLPEFTWSTSFYIDCNSEADFDAVFAGLAEGGTVMMGPEPVMDLRKVAWVTDKFGITWQPVWS